MTSRMHACNLGRYACGTYCGLSFEAAWHAAMREAVVEGDPSQRKPLRVLPLHNTQAHALTCSTRTGSLGQHFRLVDGAGPDALEPPLDAALATLRSFEWVGLTDLMDHSLCLLHFQANGSLPAACDCSAPAAKAAGKLSLGLPRFTHGVVRRDPNHLPPDVLEGVDAHTRADAQLFAAALRLLLGRLRTVEQRTGAALLACLDWERLHRATGHIEGLWSGPEGLLGS